MIYVCQLAASRINIFTPAATQPYVYFVRSKVLHESIDFFFLRLLKFCGLNRIVFYDVDEIGGYLPVEFYEVGGILFAIVEIFKEDVLEGDFATCGFIEIVE